MFLYSKWLELPLPVRHEVAKVFNIAKTGPTEVFSNQIKSDGYKIKDVEDALTVPALQAHLKLEDTDMSFLWDRFMARLDGFETVPIGVSFESPETAAALDSFAGSAVTIDNNSIGNLAAKVLVVDKDLKKPTSSFTQKKPIKRVSKPRAKKTTGK